MNKINCEDVVVKIMAVIDGEKSDFSNEQIAEHLANCESCRQEAEQLQNTVILLKKQKRRDQDANLWLEIENRIGAQTKTTPQEKWQPFILLGVFLIAYKLLEILPERGFGLWLKLVPFVLVIALFGFLRENPFKIKTELTLKI